MALLFPAASTRTLPIHLHGWKTARYESRRTMPMAGNLKAFYKKGDEVTIYYNRTPLREPIKSVFIQVYPPRIEYTFNFIFNKRPITMKVTQEQLLEWNAPPPAKPQRKRKYPKVKEDTFTCSWGVYRLRDYPDTPKRYAAYLRAGRKYPGIDALFASLADMLRLENERDVIPTGDLCQAPDASQSPKNSPNFNAARVSLVPIPEMTERQRIAHEKFLAFMEQLDKPRYTRAELYDYITNRLALIKERQIA